MSKLGLTAYQRQTFRQWLHDTADAHLYRRLLVVLEVDSGKSVSELALLLNVSHQSIYNWIGRFRRHGDPVDLTDHYGIGRPTLWTEERAACLRALLHSSPDQWGYFANDWTVPLLKEQLLHHTGRAFAEDTIRRQLHSLGYVWKRGRYLLAPDPELEKKTANSQNHPSFAASKHPAGRGRNRPAPVSAFAGRLVAAGPTPRNPY
jgi:transposase